MSVAGGGEAGMVVVMVVVVVVVVVAVFALTRRELLRCDTQGRSQKSTEDEGQEKDDGMYRSRSNSRGLVSCCVVPCRVVSCWLRRLQQSQSRGRLFVDRWCRREHCADASLV
ncbi:hypothetical protein F4801DRAFT_581615 [Xylaria longipes]|nr:hypothetical protein F4801DRAFT_581615 [Xylaria longipes]